MAGNKPIKARIDAKIYGTKYKVIRQSITSELILWLDDM